MTDINRQAVIDSLSRLVTPGIKLTALADELAARKQDYAGLRATLMELVEEGVVHVLPGGAFALAPQGRRADPRAVPVPPVPPEPPPASAKTKLPWTKKAAKPAAHKTPPAAPRMTTLAAKAPRVAVKKPEPPRSRDEEYDPETGEMKKVIGAKAAAAAHASSGSAGARSNAAGAAQVHASAGARNNAAGVAQVHASAGSAGARSNAAGAAQVHASSGSAGARSNAAGAAQVHASSGSAGARSNAAGAAQVHASSGSAGARSNAAGAAQVDASSGSAGARSNAAGAAQVDASAGSAGARSNAAGVAQVDVVDDRIIGRITVHPAGYGFVATDAGETVFVPAKYRGTSLDGDRVAVDTWAGVRGTEGRVSEVLARGRARLTGILRRIGRAVYLEPDDPRIAADYGRVGIDGTPIGRDGEAIVVEITRYPDAVRRELGGRVLKVLGDPDDPRTEIEKILACAVIPIEFPDEAAAQAKATSQELTAADLADRIDLRDRRFCTIDPETARDFDDALCIEDGPHGGTRVWVAVADVSHYVRWGDALDREAAIRGVSVYLPDRVIPMLPFQLSGGICSLNPNVDRCAMVVRLDYADDGSVADVGHAAAVINSKGRLDYPGVAAALEGDFRGRREMYRPWQRELERLNALARVLRARRQKRGALELEIAEPKVVLDADDPRLVRDVVKAKGDPAVKQAYQLVEEFMIAANEAVGGLFRRRDAPTVWRVHAPPAEDRVARLAELLGAYGIAVDVHAAVTPLGMKQVLDDIAGKPGAQALSFLVLRTLTQAVWDTVPIGHFGLASGDYLHFTSPIRRYPDLLVHRLLKHQLHRDGHASGGGYAKPPPDVTALTELAAASSANERRAMEAEREAVAMYRAYLMRDQIGQRFDGVVSAVTNFGAFVEIESPYVEGLIKLDALGDEPFAFDDIHMRLAGKRTGKAIELGDKVTVEILNVSVVRRRIEFALVGTVASAQRLRPQAAPVPSPRAGIAQRKKAGRELARAQPRGKASARDRAGDDAGGKLRLGVSHRKPDGGGRKRK